MTEHPALTLECFIFYVEERRQLLRWLENRDNYKRELLEALESFPPPPHLMPFDKLGEEIRETLNNLPEIERRVRFDLEVLENAPVRRDFEAMIPADCASADDLKYMQDLIYRQKATTIEEAIEICRAEKLP